MVSHVYAAAVCPQRQHVVTTSIWFPKAPKHQSNRNNMVATTNACRSKDWKQQVHAFVGGGLCLEMAAELADCMTKTLLKVNKNCNSWSNGVWGTEAKYMKFIPANRMYGSLRPHRL